MNIIIYVLIFIYISIYSLLNFHNYSLILEWSRFKKILEKIIIDNEQSNLFTSNIGLFLNVLSQAFLSADRWTMNVSWVGRSGNIYKMFTCCKS